MRFGYQARVGLPNFLVQKHEGEGDRHVGSIRYAVTAPSRRASSLARSRALQSISAPPREMILDLWRMMLFLEKWTVERRICSQLSLTEGPEQGLQPLKPRIDQGTHTVDAGDWMDAAQCPPRIPCVAPRKQHGCCFKHEMEFGVEEILQRRIVPFCGG